MKYIKKIKIETVETFLDVKLLRNVVSIGFDVSMHSTGIAIIKMSDTYLTLEKIKTLTVPKKVNLLDGINIFLDQIDDFKEKMRQKYVIDFSIIEDCFFGQNVNTLKALARFGILIYDRFRGISKQITFLLPSPARSKIKFKKSAKNIKGQALKKEIVEYINMALGLDLKIKDQDIADAIVLALAGIVEE